MPQEVTARECDGGCSCPSVPDSVTRGSCGGCTRQRVYETCLVWLRAWANSFALKLLSCPNCYFRSIH